MLWMGTEMNLGQMWEALAQYQPHAERHGFGPEWERMTTERTAKAARVASDAAWVAGCNSPWMAAWAASWAVRAIEDITRAIELETTP